MGQHPAGGSVRLSVETGGGGAIEGPGDTIDPSGRANRPGMIERAQHPRRVRSPGTKNPDTAYTHDSESMSRGARVWRRVVGAFASEKPRFRSAHLWTLVKYILVPRGRESSAAVRHVEARPAGAALLGEVRISSRQRAPALVARPLRSLLAGQVVTPRPGRGDTREDRVVWHLLGDRKMLHEPRVA